MFREKHRERIAWGLTAFAVIAASLVVYFTVKNFEIGDNTSEGIKHGVKYQRLQRGTWVTFRMRYALYNGIKNILNAHAGPTRCPNDFLTFATD